MLPRVNIDQEDIATALKAAGSNRTFVDRQDYVAVLKELGSKYRYIDDQDLLLAAKRGGGNGGDGDVAILKKEFPDMAGMDATVDLFQIDGHVAVFIYTMSGPFGIIGSETVAGGGPEVVVNGGFDSADGWIISSDWTVSGGVLQHTPVGPAEAGITYQEGVSDPSGSYQLEVDITGTVGYVVFNSTQAIYPNEGHAVYPVNGLNGVVVNVSASDDFDGTLDNISVKENLAFAMTIGTDEKNGMFADSDGQQIIPPSAIWVNSFLSEDFVPVGDVLMPMFAHLDSSTVRLFFRGGGSVEEGSMTVFCQWFPLEDGATVTAV